jgi:hypothetical protein
MKTKSLLAAGLLMAATAASSVAQTVYSVNVVGFVNLSVPAGFSMISNPLEAQTNTVASLFPSVPNGTRIFKFNRVTGQFDPNSFLGAWSDSSMTLVPGEGVFIRNSSGSPFTITFVGNVRTGPSTNSLSVGFNLISSVVPQQGALAPDLEFPIENGDRVFIFDNSTGQYDSYSYLFSQWAGPNNGTTPPIIVPGQSFWVKRNLAAVWTRNFVSQ